MIPNVPGVFAVYEKVAPAARVPLLKLAPSLDVTVCAIPSLFFQLTVVPVFTVKLEGPNAIPAMLTLFDVPTLTGFPLFPEPSDLLHEKLKTETKIVRQIHRNRLLVFIIFF
jgi:hypothetical protein